MPLSSSSVDGIWRAHSANEFQTQGKPALAPAIWRKPLGISVKSAINDFIAEKIDFQDLPHV
jgi:hypothetical protein